MGQPHIPPTPAGTSLKGKTVLVTGGNSGIGLETARQFLKLEASRVIITVRDQVKGEEAVAKLRQDPEVITANPSANIDVFLLDLDDYQSGLAFTEKTKRDVLLLDVLVCNGGINVMNYQVSKTGHEKVMQVNCYTHFLIILELLPLLQKTAAERKTPSRVTFTGSAMQRLHSLSKTPIGSTENVLVHFDNRKLYHGFQRYNDSKLVLNAFVRHISTIVPETDIIVNNFCPGLVETGFGKDISPWLKVIMYFYRKMSARTVQEGGHTAVYASVVSGPESHGQFLQSNEIYSWGQLWDEVGKNFPGRLWVDLIADLISVDPSLSVYAT